MEDASREALIGFLRRPRYEVLPLAGVERQVLAHVPQEVTLTVTASPAKGIDATLALTQFLAEEGFRAVPHLSARLVRDDEHLAEILGRIAAMGVDEAFVIAGDQPAPVGKFSDALALLDAMATIGHKLREVGIAGYPERHPLIDDDVTIQAMWDKRRYATYIVSNVCFNAETVVRWVARVRRRGVTLPVHVGVPGLVDSARLLRIASRIGLGESARFLRWHSNWLLRLVVPGGYRPDRLIAGLVPDLADSPSRVAGLHFFTFNEVERTERWRQDALARLEWPEGG